MSHQREMFAWKVRALVDRGMPVILEDVLEVLSRGSMRIELVEQVMFARLNAERRDAGNV